MRDEVELLNGLKVDVLTEPRWREQNSVVGRRDLRTGIRCGGLEPFNH